MSSLKSVTCENKIVTWKNTAKRKNVEKGCCLGKLSKQGNRRQITPDNEKQWETNVNKSRWQQLLAKKTVSWRQLAGSVINLRTISSDEKGDTIIYRRDLKNTPQVKNSCSEHNAHCGHWDRIESAQNARTNCKTVFPKKWEWLLQIAPSTFANFLKSEPHWNIGRCLERL